MKLGEYERFIHLSRYSRFREDLGRREEWEETVERLRAFWWDKIKEVNFDLWDSGSPEIESVFKSILELEVMPSMRTLMTAGPALNRDNVAGYNCSYLPIESLRDFDELFYILMCGTGVGFSVETRYINQLPVVAETFHDTDSVIVVSDSKIGWASSFRELVSLLWSGKVPKYDLSRVRPSGAPLKTFGGRASGPGPLDDLFKFTIDLCKGAAGRKLTSLECHDLVCKIADVVVVGGVRRSALISLCDLGDDDMRTAKSGNWWIDHPHRALANISAVYESKPSFEVFLKEWKSLYESKSGERGIFNRAASKIQAAKNGRREIDFEFGTNPCSEIILRPRQFCNLSEVVVRPNDSLEDLKRKVRLATILGTLQSTLTEFRYLRKEWKRNTEEERLLGVSITGICDHPILSDQTDYGCSKYDDNVCNNWLEELKNVAIETNAIWAERLGIGTSTAITCVKPSGTVSQLVDSSSGIHPRFSDFYIRAVRADVKDPLAQFMIDQGFPYEKDKMKPDHQYVFYFPKQAPDESLNVDDVSAIDQMNLWKDYQESWCEHKPSITIYYKNSEFLELGQMVYNDFDSISGISFLPRTDHNYPQAPYTKITEKQYNEFLEKMPVNVDWSGLASYEGGKDNTEGAQQLACVSGVCEF